jgi:trehalose synthase
MHNLEDYRTIIGNDIYADIHRRARKLYDKHFVHINSTYAGGGVAEMLVSLIPLMNNTGIETGWRVLAGNADFFNTTKKFHNGLQGEKINLSEVKKHLYVAQNDDFSTYTHISAHDAVVVHDPQPLPLVKFYKRKQPWIWRCHIDISHPDPDLWDFLAEFIIRYDVMIISSELYRKDLPIEQRIFPPAIDPLSAKNMPISAKLVEKNLARFGVKTDKPLLVQISRFDKWKDPVGVVKTFLKVKQEVDCRLVLCGSTASDDPEGEHIYREVEEMAGPYIESGDVVLINYESNILVNALQRSATAVLQKSIREGFGLTVTEAMWKGKPVVSTKVGGIPLQIEDNVNGLITDPDDDEGFAHNVLRVLKNPEWAAEIGAAGQDTVKNKFIITRLLSDYLDLMCDLVL